MCKDQDLKYQDKKRHIITFISKLNSYLIDIVRNTYFLYLFYCTRQNNCPLNGIKVLMPRTSEYITLHGKNRFFSYKIKKLKTGRLSLF